jgi:hypothetical protein
VEIHHVENSVREGIGAIPQATVDILIKLVTYNTDTRIYSCRRIKKEMKI